MRLRPRTGFSDELPEPCRRCTYWELDGGARGPDVAPTADEPLSDKRQWWEAAALEWQPVGLVVADAEECVGYALLGPPRQFPRAKRLGGASPDAMLLAMLWAADDEPRIVDALVRAALSSAVSAGARAVEAFATRRPGEPCHPPLAVLERAGFAVHRNRGVHPLMRLDVRQTPGVRDRAAEALQGLRGVVPRRREAPSLPATGG